MAYYRRPTAVQPTPEEHAGHSARNITMDDFTPTNIAAALTAYHPTDGILATIDAASAVCSAVIVVDNTPGGAQLLRQPLPEGTRVLPTERNLGLAAALNLAIAELSPEIDAVLLLDQDSALEPEAVSRLAERLSDPTIGAAAPAPWDAATNSFIDPRTVLRAELADRDVVITSGMLVRRSILDDLGGFRDDFFVDCVDQDFCLRVRRAGWRIVQDRSVKLPHSLGEMRSHRFLIGHVRVSHHPTWRLYWVMRNGLILIGERGRKAPGWALTSALIMIRWITLTALYEAPRLERLRAMRRGLADGLRRRVDRRYIPESGSARSSGSAAGAAATRPDSDGST